MNQKGVRVLLILSALAAIAVVLRMFAVQFFTNNRMIIHNIPVIISGLLFGPFAGAAVGMVADVSSLPYQAGWRIEYMFAAGLWGFIPGLLRYLFNYKKKWGLVAIESITHVVVSFVNTLLLIPYIGWAGAVGQVTFERPIAIQIILFENTITLIDLGQTFYLRIVIVILMMLIKIPIDVYLVRKIDKLVLEPLEIGAIQWKERTTDLTHE